MLLLRVLFVVCLATVSFSQTPDVPSSGSPQVVTSGPPVILPAETTAPPAIVIVTNGTSPPAPPVPSTDATTTTTTTTTVPPTPTTASTPAPTDPTSSTTTTTTTTTTAATTKVPETTTPAATSTSSVAPSPTPTPQTYPLNRGTWSVQNDASPESNCILFEGAMRLELPKAPSNETVTKDVPVTAVASGSCGNAEQTLSLQWTVQEGTTVQTNFLEVVFEMNNSTRKYGIISVKYSTDTPVSGAPSNVDLNMSQTVEVSSDKSYRCSGEEAWVLSESAVILVNDIQFEAFRLPSKTGKEFSESELCSPDARQTVTIVGFIVGGILATVVILTTALYLGRRYGWCTRRAAGYQPLDGGLE